MSAVYTDSIAVIGSRKRQGKRCKQLNDIIPFFTGNIKKPLIFRQF